MKQENILCAPQAPKASEEPGTSKDTKTISRRGLFALAGAGAMSVFLFSAKAWAAIGSGGWGAQNGIAAIGAHFGYDSGWSWSWDGSTCISQSSNCMVTRMSELLTEIQIDTYLANGGIMPNWWVWDGWNDTVMQSWISGHPSGEWSMFSEVGCDVLADYYYYHGPYTITAGTLRREVSAWNANCVARTFCPASNADRTRGADTNAVGIIQIPAHTLNDDYSWQGKIFTMSARFDPSLRLGVVGGGSVEGSPIAVETAADTTNQCWTRAATGHNEGRDGNSLSVLEPINVTSNTCLAEASANPWGHGGGICLQTWRDQASGIMWLHNLGNGYHYPVFQHSGMALGIAWRNAIMYNAFQYSGRDNASCNFALEEVTFKARERDAMKLSGTIRVGGVAATPDPDAFCIPYNYPGTQGMYWKWTWYTGEVEGALTTLVHAASNTGSYEIAKADEGKYLTCVITAFSRHWNIPFKGSVQTSSALVARAVAKIEYYADTDTAPCYQEEVLIGGPYSIPVAASAAATKPDCDGFDGWYTDQTYTTLADAQFVATTDTKLYGRNRALLTYAVATSSCTNNTALDYFSDEACSIPASAATMVPAPVKTYYGVTIRFAAGSKLYFRDAGRTRVATCAAGAYPAISGLGTPLKSAKLTHNTTVYLAWTAALYDGVSVG